MDDSNKTKFKINRVLAVIIGSIIISFANIAFLEPLQINSGGLNGVSIIFNFNIANEVVKKVVYNSVYSAFSITLWFVGFFIFGKKFAFKTLLATIIMPIANWFFSMAPFVSDFIAQIGEAVKVAGGVPVYEGGMIARYDPSAGNYLFAGLFSGALVGLGVGITFIGGGSSGGVDVLTFVIQKYLHIRESIGSFIIDGSIILCGAIVMFTRPDGIDNYLMPCMSGVVSALVAALVIEFVYIRNQTYYQVDVISEKWEEISRFVQDDLGRGATVIPCKGGYKGDERIILRIVFHKKQYQLIRKFIANVDPNAFITYTQTDAVFGEGFKKISSKRLEERKKKNTAEHG